MGGEGGYRREVIKGWKQSSGRVLAGFHVVCPCSFHIPAALNTVSMKDQLVLSKLHSHITSKQNNYHSKMLSCPVSDNCPYTSYLLT